jgi:hypothetical protein
MKTYIAFKVNSQLEYSACAELIALKLEIVNTLTGQKAFDIGYKWILYGIEENWLYHAQNSMVGSEGEFVDSGAKTVDEFIKFIKSFKNAEVTIQLNKHYSAKVTADKVVVDCQTFDASKIIEVAETIKKLQARKL